MLAFLLANPILSHSLLAAGFGSALLAALHFAGVPMPEVIAGATISAIFWGREAGQLEHDLKNQGWQPVNAWLGSAFMYGWAGSNWAQWLAPTATIGVICAGAAILAP